ncbi:MAG: glycosyltransferase family 2 protein [Candidatus Caenarcaniphilales bacterium]|jgi:dolichol-phosphate mannosyltransferase|nr:glycosyltransferase family 2 protein [Candidatus Caenarcaniphilales bacterium]
MPKDDFKQGVLSVVIPAHNEEGHIAETVGLIIDKLNAEKIDHEILVVNDNSRDNTEVILKQLVEKYPSFRYVNNEPPNGFGFAVIKGLNSFSGEYVAVMMADNSDDPADLVKFYRKISEGYDCVFGTRFHESSKIVDYPFIKLILNRFGNAFIQLLFMHPYNDFTNAFKMFRRSTINGLRPFLSQHFNLTVELPLKAVIRGYSYTVVPNNWYNRKEGVSKFKIRELGSRYMFIVLYCFLERLLLSQDFNIKKLQSK